MAIKVLKVVPVKPAIAQQMTDTPSMLDATYIDDSYIPAPQHYCTSRASSTTLNKNKQTVKMSLATKLLVLVLTVTWVSGCATRPSPPDVPPEYCMVADEAQLPKIRRVALVTTSEPPTIGIVTLGHTRVEGAADGAAAGASAAVDLTLGAASSASDPRALLIVPLLLPVIAAWGAAGGAVVGIATGHAPDTLAEAEANTQVMLKPAYLQTELLQRTQDYGRANVDLEFIRLPSINSESRVASQAYTGLADQSIDAVLEVELRRISFKYSLEMQARSRLVSSRTGELLSENKHVFKSESRRLNEWTENGAVQVSEAIQLGLTVIAEDIVYKYFSQFARKGRQDQFAKADSGNFINPDTAIIINPDTAIKRIFAQHRYEKLGSEFSPTLLNIPEGKSAIFIYRPESFPDTLATLNTEWTVPIMFNQKYLSRLPMGGFDCLIVEPGVNTIVYPTKLTNPFAIFEEIAIAREFVETKSNEIAYFSVTLSPGFTTAPISIESVIENEAVDTIRANRRAEMQIINQE